MTCFTGINTVPMLAEYCGERLSVHCFGVRRFSVRAKLSQHLAVNCSLHLLIPLANSIFMPDALCTQAQSERHFCIRQRYHLLRSITTRHEQRHSTPVQYHRRRRKNSMSMLRITVGPFE